MTLKFKKPEIKNQRLKFLVFGEMGSGKSTLCCLFPNTAYFDTEDSTSKIKYARAIGENGGGVVNTGDIDEIISQVKELITTKHDYKTIVIDSLTVAYENLLIEAEKKVGSDFGRHISFADSKVKQLVNLLLRADANVVVTCQSKREYGNNMNVIGNTYAGYKRLGYMFDLVLETSVLGRVFNAVVRKSRLEHFETGERIDFSYQEILKRCGAEAIEKSLATEMLASKDQVMELKRLVQLLNVPENDVQKWLTKESCDMFEDMAADRIDKCIAALKAKIENK